MKNKSEKFVPENLLPEDFLANIRNRSEINFEKFIQALSLEQPILSVRLNPFKKNNSIFSDQNNVVPWSEEGFYLNEKKSFSQDPNWHAGEYYVQEASSMFVGWIIKQLTKKKPEAKLVLDACAAPGGKSTNILCHLEPESYLLSNEVIASRKQILLENICKWGQSNAGVSNKNIEQLVPLGAIFDFILVDAPCSGEGLFRRIPAYRTDWNTELVNLCQLRQKKILSNSYKLLKEDGFLVYSTCTFNHEENIKNVCWIADQFELETVDFEIPAEWNITTIEENGRKGHQFFPHKTKGEGFFLSVLQKSNRDSGNSKSKVRFKKNRKQSPITKLTLFKKELPSLISTIPGCYKLYVNEYQELIALSEVGIKLIDLSFDKFIKIEPQILGQFKGKDFIPSHFLAMSNWHAANIPKVRLEKSAALKYLSKEGIDLSDYPKGWLLICFENAVLGWAKNLGNRNNNYYPKNFRLRKIVEK